MKKTMIMSILVCSLRLVCLGQATNDEQPKACRHPEYVAVFANIYNARVPNVPSNLPNTCLKDAKDKVAQWRAEDKAAFERQSNLACSGLLGWVETTPLICNAGSYEACPKKAEHWKQDPGAFGRWKDEQEEVRKKRAAELFQAGCSCQVRELRQGDISMPPASAPLPITPAYYLSLNSFFSCGNGHCPNGYKCEGGMCVSDKTIKSESPLDKVEDEIKDHVRDKAIEKVISKYQKVLAKAYGHPFVGIVLGVLEPVNPLLHKDVYRSTVKGYQMNIGELLSLYGEGIKTRKDNPSERPLVGWRKSENIDRDISNVREKLKKNMTRFNDNFEAAIRENELNPLQNDCQGVFEYQHQLVRRSFEAIMSLPTKIDDISIPSEAIP